MTQIDDALNKMLGKKKQPNKNTSMSMSGIFNTPSTGLGLSSMFPQTAKAVKKSNIIQGVKRDAKKAFQPLFNLADTGKILGGASTQKQKQWKNMSTKKKAVARKKYVDSDGDRVPNRYDCQPRNTMRQDDDEKTGIKLGDAKSMSKIPHRFIFITPTTISQAMKIWGYNSVKEFEDSTGVDRGEIYNTFLEDPGDVNIPVKHYSAYDVYRSGKRLPLLFGNPSRLSLESFQEYMSMYYNFRNGYMYDK